MKKFANSRFDVVTGLTRANAFDECTVGCYVDNA